MVASPRYVARPSRSEWSGKPRMSVPYTKRRSSPATKHGLEFLKGPRIALAGHPHEVVVMRAGDREKALGRRRGLEEPLCVPEGHDLVGLTMHEEDGTADMRDLVDVPELVERQEGQPGHDPEGRHEARLDDESGHGVARGEIHGRSRSHRTAVRDDAIGRNAPLAREVLIGGLDVTVGVPLGRTPLARAIAAIVV